MIGQKLSIFDKPIFAYMGPYTQHVFSKTINIRR